MKQRMRLGQGAQYSVLLKNLRPSTVVSGHLPNVLPTQRLDDIGVSHQSQVTCRGLSYKAVFFSFATIPGETLHCAKSFVFLREDGLVEGLFEKDSAPPPPEIEYLTAPPPARGDPIEADVFNASNRAEDIALVRN